MNPPPLDLPATLYLFGSMIAAPPGCRGFVPLEWDGAAWVGRTTTSPRWPIDYDRRSGASFA